MASKWDGRVPTYSEVCAALRDSDACVRLAMETITRLERENAQLARRCEVMARLEPIAVAVDRGNR